MSDIFLHNPQNKLSQELADSFNENVNVIDYSDEVNNLLYPVVSKLPCFVLHYPEHDVEITVFDDQDNEVQETVTIPSGYLEFFMLNEIETINDDGTRLHTYTKKSYSEYTEWKTIKEQEWS